MRPSQSPRTTDAKNLPLAWVTNWVTIGSDASGRAGILMDGSSSSTSMKRHGQSPVLVAWGSRSRVTLERLVVARIAAQAGCSRRNDCAAAFMAATASSAWMYVAPHPAYSSRKRSPTCRSSGSPE